MAKVSMLIKKVYLLAGVVMAANMFIVNEVKAMETEQPISSSMMPPTDNDNSNTNMNNNEKPLKEGTIDTGKGKTGVFKIQFVQNITNKVSSHENIINLFGGLAFSCVNNYFKLWDYNPGMYCKPVWLGWRSKRFLNGMLQSELNLNVVRGILWLIPGAYIFIKGIVSKKKVEEGENKVAYIKYLHVSYLVAYHFLKIKVWEKIALMGFFFLVQGFLSIPLTIHISNFSISVSLDSIIWGGIGKYLDLKIEKRKREMTKDIQEQLVQNQGNNVQDDTNNNNNDK